jgi:hypothetical protein
VGAQVKRGEQKREGGIKKYQKKEDNLQLHRTQQAIHTGGRPTRHRNPTRHRRAILVPILLILGILLLSLLSLNTSALGGAHKRGFH